MVSIIERLNSLAHLTPDEIVAKITSQGWVHGPDVTEEMVRASNMRVYSSSTFDRNRVLDEIWPCATDHVPNIDIATVLSVIRKRHYWIIPVNEYTPGSLPPIG